MGDQSGDASGSTVVPATDQAHTGSNSIKATQAGGSAAFVCVPNGTCADAGTRISFWVRFSKTPASGTSFFIIQQASDVAGVQTFTRDRAAQAAALMQAQAAADTYLAKSVWLCGAAATDPRCKAR